MTNAIETQNTDSARDFCVKHEIASKQELDLVTKINGYNWETIMDVIYARTGYRTIEQYVKQYVTCDVFFLPISPKTNQAERAWDFCVENEIASRQELDLVTKINGYNWETIMDVIYVRTGYSHIEQYVECEGSAEQNTDTETNSDATSGRMQPTCSALVMPIKMATVYLSEEDGPYRMEIRGSEDTGGAWAYFYKGAKLVWDCNDFFAKHHFYSLPNDQGDSQSPDQ